MAPKLENKKVVLILSPTWFSKTGAESSGFSARFSESMYEQMLANDELSQETRNAIADRVDQMLQISPDTQASARTARSMIAGGRVSLKDRIAYRVEKWINTEKEDINVGLLWKASGGKTIMNIRRPKQERNRTGTSLQKKLMNPWPARLTTSSTCLTNCISRRSSLK